MANCDDEINFEGPNVSRLKTPMKINDVLTKCPEFAITTEEDFEREEELSMTEVYDYEKLEPYTLLENLDADSDYDDDNPERAFSIYRKQMFCVTDDAKIMKKFERTGLGEIVGNCPKVVTYVHYASYTDLNEIPFDVSRLRQKKPVSLKLGIDSVVEGLEMAIRTMKIGEKSKFLIHPDLAFGVRGVPPRIPPNATILYDIELIDFSENEALQIRFEEEEEKLPKSFEQTLKMAKESHYHGNKLKKHEKNINAAIASYRKGLYLLLNFHYKNAEEEQESKKEMLRLYTNLVLCHMEKKNYKRVCSVYNDACHDCDHLAKNSPKLLYHSAKALKCLGDYKEAAVRLKRALQLKPEDPDIIRELEGLNATKTYHEKEEKQICRKMFGFYKNEPHPDDDKLVKELIDQVNDEFKQLFIEEIEDFVKSDQDSIKLSYGATQNEKEFCKIICNKNFLSFRETKVDGNSNFIITKKL